MTPESGGSNVIGEDGLAALPGAVPVAHGQLAGAADQLALDERAAQLLERFYVNDDPRAFEALVECTLETLLGAAEAIASELALAVDAEGLVVDFYARLFVDLGRRARGGSFVAEAERSIRRDAESRLDARWTAPEVAPGAGFCELYRTFVQHAFHGLDRRQRRLLLAADVHGTSTRALAAELAMPEQRVRDALQGARRRLADGVGRLLRGLARG